MATAATWATRTQAVPDRRFFGGMAFAMLALAVIGFGPSYYWSSFVPTPAYAQPLSPLVHVHAVLFTAWLLLLNAQTTLVSVGRRDLHMKLGWFGAALAVALVVVGPWTAIEAAAAGRLGRNAHIPPDVFLAIPLANILVFGVLFGAALALRKRAQHHKRLVMIAGSAALVPAAARILQQMGGFGALTPILAMALTNLFIVALALFDWRTRGRLHPATLWGGLFVIGSEPMRVAVGQTDAWRSFAQALIA